MYFQDNSELFAMMEKTRMYIFRGQDPEVRAINEQEKCPNMIYMYNVQNVTVHLPVA